MTAARLDGAAVAGAMRAEVQADVVRLREAGLVPALAVILAGDDPASAVYVAGKARACEEAGLRHETVRLAADVSTDAVIAHVQALNARPDVHGILVQLPLPRQVDASAVLHAVDPSKDVDGFHPCNAGLLLQGHSRLPPCTPAGVMELFRRTGVELAGRRAVVVGRSDIVGKPMALLLLQAHATVTVAHSRTLDLAAVTRAADVLVVAAGRPGLVRAEHVAAGAVVVDVGIHRITDPAQAHDLLGPDRLEGFRARGSALVGDVHAPSVSRVARALTPVPGGVGPLTIAQLLRNTVRAASGG